MEKISQGSSGGEKIPQTKEHIDQVIKNASQEEWAKILQKNIKHLLDVQKKNLKDDMDMPRFLIRNQLYEVLTARPELRKNAMDTFTRMPGWKDREPQPEGWKEYTDKVKSLEKKFPNSEYDGAWLHFTYKNPTNKEADGKRRKGYVTMAESSTHIFEKNLAQIMDDIDLHLAAVYSGKMKISISLKNLREKFDNIVLHGANKQEVVKALYIVKSVLEKYKIVLSGEQFGIDGKSLIDGEKTSHSMLLAEKIVLGLPIESQ